MIFNALEQVKLYLLLNVVKYVEHDLKLFW